MRKYGLFFMILAFSLSLQVKAKTSGTWTNAKQGSGNCASELHIHLHGRFRCVSLADQTEVSKHGPVGRWQIRGKGGSECLLEQWNMKGQGFSKWFTKNRAFMLDSDAKVKQVNQGVLRLTAIAAKTHQAYERRFAVFTHGDNVLRLTCICKDREGQKGFDGLVKLISRQWRGK